MSLFKQSSKILGMNARNLDYIMKYNTSESKKFADDKLFTKQFLESRGIGVAKLYNLVKNHQQLTKEFFKSLPESFVIKPNRGFAGAGILVITKTTDKGWTTISDKFFNQETMYMHCIDILEGKYSISGTRDDVIFEEKLDPHTEFRTLTNSGLPDVRVIVFNMVPVMAMLRVPTPESDGKANMELGAIGMGIDLGTGKTNGAALKSDVITKLPNGEPAIGFEVPFWEEILLMVSKIQQVTNIGFLGVDLVITRTGVKVLEVNARPGLKIQVANGMALKSRLEKVADLKVLTPEDGVGIAKKLFSQGMLQEEGFEKRPIIGPIEAVMLNSDPPQELVAQIDLTAETNIIASRYFDEDEKVLDITMEGQRMKLPMKKGHVIGADMILAAKFLKDFYIDPNKKFVQKSTGDFAPKSVDDRMLVNIDEKICEIDKTIKLLLYINPRNLAEQKVIFLNHTAYSPRFFYKECDLDFGLLRSELKRVPQVNHALYPLYKEKIEELQWKLNLLESRNTLDFGTSSEKVFGGVNRVLYQSALKSIEVNKKNYKPDESELINTKDAIEILQKFLEKHHLGFWKIKILEDSVVDIQVTKKEKILIKKGAKFQRNRLEALLVHEIGTHVFRFENGKRQPLRLLERGTSGYLKTEEGLAVWNQNQLGLALGEKSITSPLLVIGIYMAKKMNFSDLFHYLKNTFEITDDLAWKICVKSKRGLEDTNLKTAFTKDSIYFTGFQEIERFVAKGGSLKELYIGKITVRDLPYMKNVLGLQEAKFFL